MTLCPVLCAWAVACLPNEASQQPTCPHSRHLRRCTHSAPLARHSSQPSVRASDSGSATVFMCSHSATIVPFADGALAARTETTACCPTSPPQSSVGKQSGHTHP